MSVAWGAGKETVFPNIRWRYRKGTPFLSKRAWSGVVASAGLLGAIAAAEASHQFSDTAGHSSLEQSVIGGDLRAGFSFIRLGRGETPHLVRELDPRNPIARAGRERRRRSLAYFGQFSDFQLVDEESPLRVEFTDPDPSGAAKTAWRPQEALVPHAVEMSIRQMNKFLESPVRQGNGERARLLNAILTGDLAENQHKNEVKWVRGLLEGGTVTPNSGSENLRDYDAFCAGLVAAGRLDRNDKYSGVQDYDDYAQSTAFYDPDEPAGSSYADWPRYPGLMDRAQDPFRAEGLKVPSYVSPGNHDLLVAGNDDANAAYEQLAGGCVKPVTTTPTGTPDSAYFRSLVNDDPTRVFPVPPDPGGRWLVDKRQYRAIFAAGRQADDHGFAYVDEPEREASAGDASYYSFSPKPGIRLISLDTSSQGGSFLFGPGGSSISTTDRGNLDHPQFLWLERELRKSRRRNELVIPFSHHAIDSMDYNVPDEAVQPCIGGQDGHQVEGVGHDRNPGCDRDPRSSTPLHLGDDLKELFFENPNVIAYVSGHSHQNQVDAYRQAHGAGRFWQIKSPAVADWPSVQRLIEVMDNRDGTLSIFGTLIDHAAPARAPRGCSGAVPRACPQANSLDVASLAAIGRTLTYNDPQVGPGPDEGARSDRNVELLIADPRRRAAMGRGTDDDDRVGDRDNRESARSGSDGSDQLKAGEAGLPFTGLALAAIIILGVLLAAAGALGYRRVAK